MGASGRAGGRAALHEATGAECSSAHQACDRQPLLVSSETLDPTSHSTSSKHSDYKVPYRKWHDTN